MAPTKKIDVFTKCQETGRSYNQDTYPMRCTTCQKVFKNRDEYLAGTENLPKGDYSKGTRSLVFEYRNCSCGSTLVCELESDRDNSPNGEATRKDFDLKVEFLQSNGVDEKKAKEIIRKKIRS